MRFAYSAHAASAQSGSLPLSATTRSLGTCFRFRLRLFLRGLGRGFGLDLHPHRLAAPDLLEVVELAHRGMHDVHHHVAEVDQYPFAARLAFHAVPARVRLDPPF